MQKISYTMALNKNEIVIIKSKKINDLYRSLSNKNSLEAVKLINIIKGNAILFDKFNSLIKTLCDELTYIDVMSNINIYVC